MNCTFFRGLSIRSSLRYAFASNYKPFSASISYPKTFSHSAILYQSDEQKSAVPSPPTVKRKVSSEEARKIAYNTVDWLPFPWQMPLPHNPFEDSGDLVKKLEFDPSWPKPDFELSEELKTANQDIKDMFSLATGNKADVKEVIKRRTLQRIQRHPNDFNSQEVDIALRTLMIRSCFEHQKKSKKERVGGRKVLYILINKRNKRLKFLRKLDMERFNWLCEELQLEYKPQKLGGTREKLTKESDLRRLTKEYCEKIIKDKKIAYHEELRKQQADFLKEKEEILAWIEKEEKELANLTI